jgi:hypothetical protein
MTYSQIFKSSDLPYFVKFAHFTNFASRFIRSVRDMFGVEIDISTNEHFLSLQFLCIAMIWIIY